MPVVDRVAAPASRNISIRGYGPRLKAGTTGMVRFNFQTEKTYFAFPRRDAPELRGALATKQSSFLRRGAKAGLLPPSLAMTGETKIKTPPGIGRRFDLSV